MKFVLTRPEAPFMANIAMPFASIISTEYASVLEAAGTREDLNNMPIGTGPFTFVAYQKDAVIRYAKNADYWGTAPLIDDLVFAITPDAAVRLQKLKAGECHLMPFPAPADIAAIKADPNLKVEEQAGLNVGYLAYNTTVAAVRQRQGAQGAEHGDQQAGDHRRRVPGRRPGRQEPDPADHVVLQRRHRR